MRRRALLGASGTALATALAGCAGLGGGDSPTTDDPATDPTTDDPTTGDGDPSGTLTNPSFEADWTGWEVGRHLPEDPNREGERAVASTAGVTTRDATDGTTSLALSIDGRQDDGTVWVGQRVDLSGYDHLAADFTVSASFNHVRNAAVYAGSVPDDPLTETDFDTSNSLEGADGDGWQTFVYDVAHDGPGYVAVGFSVVWETHARALVDDVRLTSEPPETVTPPTSETTTSPGADTDDGSGDQL